MRVFCTQSLPVMVNLSEDEKCSDSNVVILTTGLNRENKDDVTRWIKTLTWAHVDEFTSQGMQY